MGLSSAVAACFNFNPTSASCVSVISWSLPNWIVPASAKNKSENSLDAEPKVVPSAEVGNIDVPKVPVLITGLVNVLFVSVSVETKDTKVELEPAGKVKVFVTAAEWGCAITIWPCELDSQLNWIAPEFVSPLIVTWPVPFATISRSILESSPVADNSGAPPLAAFVISNWFTAEPVVWNIICSLPFSSAIKCASSIKMFAELVSKSPPNWGEVSSTISDIAPDVASPATIVDLAIFLRPPPEVSTAMKTSSFATVDISDKPVSYTHLTLPTKRIV